MKIIVNGHVRECVQETGGQLLDELKIDDRFIAIERNGNVLTRQAFSACTLEDGDVLEIIRFVGGGC
ncbi:sulfur carrier protein ThiS [Ferroacidibacillus organovorans]|uniref:sulfur carrier protein ThiS n=1 Tax=Ferroacidibacillus organovorans TaxID=1765683 RepID=UPI0007A8457D|nr:sulfur carrier protein ThiS [Ferroacidibacillus organovorans]KYP81876.1 hypothetical protein AYJ22_15935 [Ferroacidibacillus organovorans]